SPHRRPEAGNKFTANFKAGDRRLVERISTRNVKLILAPEEGAKAWQLCKWNQFQIFRWAFSQNWSSRHSVGALGYEKWADSKRVHASALEAIDGLLGSADNGFVLIEAGV